MHFFRFLGDFLMVSSRAVIIKKVSKTESVSGISLRTHFIYLVAYVFRYLDMFSTQITITKPLSVYNSIMKIFFISFQVYTIYLIAFKYRATYNRRFDTLDTKFIFVPAFLLSFFIKGRTSTLGSYLEEYLYTCSLVLESVAILPQLVVVQDAGECESLTSQYILLLGLYRLAYIVYFISRYYSTGRLDPLVLITSLIQTALYVDFFMVYYRLIIQKRSFTRQL